MDRGRIIHDDGSLAFSAWYEYEYRGTTTLGCQYRVDVWLCALTMRLLLTGRQIRSSLIDERDRRDK